MRYRILVDRFFPQTLKLRERKKYFWFSGQRDQGGKQLMKNRRMLRLCWEKKFQTYGTRESKEWRPGHKGTMAKKL